MAKNVAGGALSMWKFERRGYKHSGNAAKQQTQRIARKALLTDIEGRAEGWLQVSDEVRQSCAASDDALDALIASLVARAAAIGETTGPAADDEEQARREGWIHLTTADGFQTLAR